MGMEYPKEGEVYDDELKIFRQHSWKKDTWEPLGRDLKDMVTDPTMFFILLMGLGVGIVAPIYLIIETFRNPRGMLDVLLFDLALLAIYFLYKGIKGLITWLKKKQKGQ